MSQAVMPFIDKMAEVSPALRDARDAALHHWAPEEVPTAVLLLALGHRLTDEFDANATARGKPLFDEIERALAKGDTETQQAASTMIEAAVARAVDLGIWPDLRPMFGEKSEAHALNSMTLDR